MYSPLLVAGGFSYMDETYDRDSYAVYLDVSTDITEKIFVQGAVRSEDYSDFGTETVWKLAGRYAVNDNLAFRGSITTGSIFRIACTQFPHWMYQPIRLQETLTITTWLWSTPALPEQSPSVACSISRMRLIRKLRVSI